MWIRRENSLTAPGFLVGTPNYVAPEIVMGRPFDGRVDQYSLAMTVHEALSCHQLHGGANAVAHRGQPDDRRSTGA